MGKPKMKKIIIVVGIAIIFAVAAIAVYCFCNRVTATDEEKASVVKGNNEFALSLYAELAKSNKDKNIFFSPYSISNALAMTYAGARGETEKQMKETLHFALEQERLHPAFFVLRRELTKLSKKGCELDVANALYRQTDREFNRDFLRLVRKYYDAKLDRVDFVKNPDKAISEINQWVEKNTKGKITEIILRKHINKLTRLILLNAISFKGEWESKFDKEDAFEDIFYSADGTKKTAFMMSQTGKFRYIKDSIKMDSFYLVFRMLEIPYIGEDISMIIFLPEERESLPLLEKAMSIENLQKCFSKLSGEKKEVSVKIPKFKFESEYTLNKNLQNMGIKYAFEDGLADFSGMTSSMILFISFVLHKAYIEVDEEGTTAAAVTAVVLEEAANEFVADHPFMFIIRNNTKGSILFMGRVMDPTKEIEEEVEKSNDTVK